MAALERHFSVQEVAEMWNLSPSAVRSLFRDRSDVLRIGHGESRFRRSYLTLRIPESTLQRVHSELRAKGA